MILVLLATGLFFKPASDTSLPFPWLLPLLFNLMLRDFLITDGIGMTREYTTIFQLIFFCVHCRAIPIALPGSCDRAFGRTDLLYAAGPGADPHPVCALVLDVYGPPIGSYAGRPDDRWLWRRCGPTPPLSGLHACAGILLGRRFSIQFLLVYDTAEVAWRSFQDHQASAGCGKLCPSFPGLRYAWGERAVAAPAGEEV